jgi:hypothetical protein
MARNKVLVDRKSLEAVVEYLWRDELLHFAGGQEADHIFRHVVRLRNALNDETLSPEDHLAEYETV